MPELNDAIAVFLHEHQGCGVVASSVEGQYLSMACDCGATVMYLLESPQPPASGHSARAI